jgi:hypothetical protein
MEESGENSETGPRDQEKDRGKDRVMDDLRNQPPNQDIERAQKGVKDIGEKASQEIQTKGHGSGQGHQREFAQGEKSEQSPEAEKDPEGKETSEDQDGQKPGREKEASPAYPYAPGLDQEGTFLPQKGNLNPKEVFPGGDPLEVNRKDHPRPTFRGKVDQGQRPPKVSLLTETGRIESGHGFPGSGIQKLRPHHQIERDSGKIFKHQGLIGKRGVTGESPGL